MKTGRTFLLALALAVFASAPAHAADANAYGAPITVKKPVALATLEKKPAKFEKKTVRIEGTVQDVCQGRGCWIRVASGEATFLAKSLDESVLVPKDCKGQRVVVQGVVTKLAPKPAEAEAPDHECPAPSYVVDTRGVELRPATD